MEVAFGTKESTRRLPEWAGLFVEMTTGVKTRTFGYKHAGECVDMRLLRTRVQW
jgi:hypothetical protein